MKMILLASLLMIGCGGNDADVIPRTDSATDTPAPAAAAPHALPSNAPEQASTTVAADSIGSPMRMIPSSADSARPSEAERSGQILKASVNSHPWSATQVSASIVDGSVSVTGLGYNGTAITINLGELKGAGKVEIGRPGDKRYATYIAENAISFSTLQDTGGGGEGTVDVKSFDGKHLTATFTFSAEAQAAQKGKVTVTEGEIDVAVRQ